MDTRMIAQILLQAKKQGQVRQLNWMKNLLKEGVPYESLIKRVNDSLQRQYDDIQVIEEDLKELKARYGNEPNRATL